MRFLSSLFWSIILCGGVMLISYSMGTPGEQHWHNVAGGFLVGTYVAWTRP